MTTIAYRDGIMAADSGVWHGDAVNVGVIKISHHRGVLRAYTGVMAAVQAHIDWVNGGEIGSEPVPISDKKEEDRSNFGILLAMPSGDLSYITHEGSEKYGRKDYIAFGGGNLAALSAMHAGATAVRAVAAAAAHTNTARLPVYWMDHDGKWGWEYR
jgi:ribulose 1,5-bisphosphate carboxylase large subunit-like protein